MSKDFNKAERYVKQGEEYKLLSYATSSESVEMTDGTDLQTKLDSIDLELNKKLDEGLKGSLNGLAELDGNGKVITTQLPSFVDDVIEGYFNDSKFYSDSSYSTEIDGESEKIYVDLSTNKTYRWSGSAFVVISETISLGETSSTAYRGDRGKVAYDHSQSDHAPSNAQENVIETIKVNGTALSPDSKSVNISVPSVNDGKVTITQNGVVKATFTLNQSGNVDVVLTDNNTTYSVATTSNDGLMSAKDKEKLNGITEGANVKFIQLTQSEYDALETKETNVMYFITD